MSARINAKQDRGWEVPARTAWRSAALAWSSSLDATGSFDEDELELSGVQSWPQRISFSQHCLFTIWVETLRNDAKNAG